MKKKCMQAIAVVLIAACMAGCSSQSGNSTPTADASTPTTDASTPTTDASTPATAAPTEEAWQMMDPVSGIALPISKELVTYSMLMFENPALPWNNDTFIVLPEMEKRSNVRFEVELAPDSGYGEKVNIQVASGDFPDLVAAGFSFTNLADLGRQGIFLNVYDYIDEMPTLKKMLDTVPGLVEFAMQSETEMYGLPAQVPVEQNITSYFEHVLMLREDLMKKHNLQTPTTYDELYALLKEFKALYPESIPMTSRNNLINTMRSLGPSFANIQIHTQAYNQVYNLETKRIESPLDNDNVKAMIEFFAKLVSEGLFDKEFVLSTAKQWEDKMVSGQSFVTYDWLARTDSLSQAGRSAGSEEFALEAIKPVTAFGQSVMNAVAPVKAYVEVNSKAKNPEILLRAVDYLFYSEPGSILQGAGIEGQTFNYSASDPKAIEFMLDEGMETNRDMYLRYGFNRDCLQGNYIETFGYAFSMSDSDYNAVYRAGQTYQGHAITPPAPVIFNEEEIEEAMTYSAMLTYVEQELTKMVLGDLPISEWDNVRQKAKSMGLDTFIEMIQNAIDRR